MVQRIDPVAMRRTLGRFTTGVTVVTTASGGDVHAMTANAFTSVSLDPSAIAHVGCSLHAEHEAGDHTRHLARVEYLHSRPGEPLVFHAGAFGRLSPEEQVLAHSWGW
jgi:flavin reductase (DIM6/NTAB) family NADH-FMN oxidoreductase RutF